MGEEKKNRWDAISNEMPSGSRSRSNSLKRTNVTAARIAARAEGIQRARERGSENNGSSPILKAHLSFDYGEEKDQDKMGDEVKALLESMKARLDTLPTSDQFNAFGKSIENNTNEIVKNSRRMDEQETKMNRITESIERIEREQVESRRSLDSRIKASAGSVKKTSDSYDTARRSIRLWPIEGKNCVEMTENVMSFLTGALEIQNVREKVGKILRVERIEDKEGSLIYSEVMVELQDRSKRDFIASRGRKLAGYVDNDRKPTCGMRMEIPEELVPTFNMLKKYGFYLKKHEGENKNHVRFDDYKRSLYLQVKFKRDGDSDWINVYPDEAHEALVRADRGKTTRRWTGSPERSPPRKRRPRGAQGWRGPMGGDDGMDVSDGEEGVEVIEVAKSKEKWKPPTRR